MTDNHLWVICLNKRYCSRRIDSRIGIGSRKPDTGTFGKVQDNDTIFTAGETKTIRIVCFQLPKKIY